MAKAKKLPSGSWRVNQYVGKDADGKRVYKSFTADSKKEAEFMAAEYVMHNKSTWSVEEMTLGEALDRYIDSKSNILSPSTIRSYKSIRENRLKAIIDTPLTKLTREMVQKAINTEALTHTPKTVKNIHGLLSATLREYYPDLNLTTTLPARIRNDIYIPTADEVNIIIKETADNADLHLAILLASCLGLRRSEICALTWDDIDFRSSTISITKALVMDSDRNWVTKPPKSYSGNRKIPIPDVVKVELQKYKRPSGKLINSAPNNISDNFCRLLKRLEIPHFRFHDLRHYNASVMLALNIPDKYAMEIMGHATNNMLKTVYQHTMEDKQREVAQNINMYFNQSMQHEMQHK